MSVLKSLRDLSEMEFYKNAFQIRKHITEWMLRDFDTKRNTRSVKQVIKDIDPADQEVIDNIFIKYGRNPKRAYQSEYPEWFVNFEKGTIIRHLSVLDREIMLANAIYAISNAEWQERRKHQNEAIGTCYLLYQEIQYIISIFPSNLNSFIEVLDSIEKEIALLKGWRKSDSRRNKGNS